MEQLFFELLQVALGLRSRLSSVPTEETWCALKDMAQMQALTGIAFHGAESLPQEQWPPKEMVIQWLAMANSIKQRNLLTTRICQELQKRYNDAGFDSCILKGQSNHRYYSKELGELRVCGDVDIWLTPKDKTIANPVKEVIEFLRKEDDVLSMCYLHVEVRPVNGVPVEVHLRPSFMNPPIRNRRFLDWFDFDGSVTATEIDGVILPCMRVEKDVIFQMNHLYRHLIDEGVGLRQVMDYYFLLKSKRNWRKEELASIIKKLGMKRFAGALMWVLEEVFCLEEPCLICEPSEQDGRFLLDEIMLAGNFGHYDLRMKNLEVRRGKTSYQVQKAVRRYKRNLRFFWSYPEEVFWEPIARISHFCWRKYELWKY